MLLVRVLTAAALMAVLMALLWWLAAAALSKRGREGWREEYMGLKE